MVSKETGSRSNGSPWLTMIVLVSAAHAETGLYENDGECVIAGIFLKIGSFFLCKEECWFRSYKRVWM